MRDAAEYRSHCVRVTVNTTRAYDPRSLAWHLPFQDSPMAVAADQGPADHLLRTIGERGLLVLLDQCKLLGSRSRQQSHPNLSADFLRYRLVLFCRRGLRLM